MKVKIKSWAVIALLLSLTAPAAGADGCGNIAMEVYQVLKEDGCYKNLSLTFHDNGCSSDCFRGISRLAVYHDDSLLTERSGITTSIFAVTRRSPICGKKTVTMKLFGADNQLLCSRKFDLEERHNAWKAREKDEAEQQSTAVAHREKIGPRRLPSKPEILPQESVMRQMSSTAPRTRIPLKSNAKGVAGVVDGRSMPVLGFRDMSAVRKRAKKK